MARGEVKRVAPKQQRAATTRLAILIAADDQIMKHGLRATTAAVAKQAGVSIGTVYRYFEDMPAIMDALGYRLARQTNRERQDNG